MKNRKSPKQLRRLHKTEAITGSWTWGDMLITADPDSNTILYYDSTPTTVTFPSGAFDGFTVGDVITISRDWVPKKKKKVHVARRRKQEKLMSHIITDIDKTVMTIQTNETATFISSDVWITA